jgi:hypothetical protein
MMVDRCWWIINYQLYYRGLGFSKLVIEINIMKF